MPIARSEIASLFVQDNTQEGIVDLNLAIVLDEAQFPEFVHEKIDPGPRYANHLRQHLSRYFGKRFVRMARRAIAREQQQRTCQTCEKVVDGSTEQSAAVAAIADVVSDAKRIVDRVEKSF